MNLFSRSDRIPVLCELGHCNVNDLESLCHPCLETNTATLLVDATRPDPLRHALIRNLNALLLDVDRFHKPAGSSTSMAPRNMYCAGWAISGASSSRFGTFAKVESMQSAFHISQAQQQHTSCAIAALEVASR